MPVLDAETPLSESIRERARGEGKSIKDFMVGRSDNYKLNPFDIIIEPDFNARDMDTPGTLEHIDGLAKSIAEIGLQRPLKVRMKGNFPVLLDGECRLRAIKRAIEHYGAEIRSVDCRLADKSMTDADAILSLVVENSGRNLTALEMADVCKRLSAYGWTLNDIAVKTGLGAVRINQLLELCAVPEEVKAMIRNDEIAPTQAWHVWTQEGRDGDRTIARIREALDDVRAKGRKRVTARHIKGSKTNLRSTLAGILTGCSVEDCGDDGYVVVFDREQFEALRALSKVDFRIVSAFSE